MAAAGSSNNLEFSAESLTKFGCEPKLAKKLVAMWLREARDSNEECLDDFLESKYFRLSQQLCDKVITPKHANYNITVQENRWLRVAVIDILRMDTVWFTAPCYDEFRDILQD